MKRKILVVDDERIIRRALEKLLTQRGYEVITAATGEEAYDLLNQHDAPKLAIVDWIMPGMDGVELCRKLRASRRGHETYVIMLTAKQDKRDVVLGFDNGADDYVRKPFDIDELHARVRAAHRLIDEQDALRSRAKIDSLTGIFNREAILDLLTRELAHTQREGKPLAVLVVDADHFKRVNDTHGHPVGDLALRHVATLLGARLRPYDAVGRFGGEEFMVVLPGCGMPYALDVAERVRRSVADTALATSAGDVVLTVSIGVATTEAGACECADLIEAADRALYEAKRAGRDRVAAASGVQPKRRAGRGASSRQSATKAKAAKAATLR